MDARFICSLSVVLSLLNTGLSLKCYTCYSQKSWTDCHRSSNGTVLKCPPDFNTCMAVHRETTYSNKTITNEYAKTCFSSDMCTRPKCKQSSPQQSVVCKYLHCCSTSRCNTGPYPLIKKRHVRK